MDTLATPGHWSATVKRIELAFGEPQFDTVMDRSVLGSLRVLRQDLVGDLMRAPNVLDLGLVAVSTRLSQRPASVAGQWLWPDRGIGGQAGSSAPLGLIFGLFAY